MESINRFNEICHQIECLEKLLIQVEEEIGLAFENMSKEDVIDNYRNIKGGLSENKYRIFCRIQEKLGKSS